MILECLILLLVVFAQTLLLCSLPVVLLLLELLLETPSSASQSELGRRLLGAEVLWILFLKDL